MEVQKILDGKTPKVRQALSDFVGAINEATLLDLASRFSHTYRELARESKEHFLVTPVTALPTGKEKGRFLSIDVGGTNLRVGLIELLAELEAEDGAENGTGTGNDGDQQPREPPAKVKKSYDKSWPIEDHLKMDKAEDLFAWIGDCIAEVLTDALEDAPPTRSPFGDELLLGITFSFPMKQTCLAEATLLPMGKGFAITSNLDLGKMLLAGYARHVVEPVNGSDETRTQNGHSKKRRLSRLPRIKLAAITNDTVATFASLAYAVKAAPNSRVAMGLIVGTGTNATVPMKIEALHPEKKAELARPDSVETVVINSEWTIRGTDEPLIALHLKTKWDLELDAQSEAPGFQPFEYMTAGRYLGEIVRLVFVDLVSFEKQGEHDVRVQQRCKADWVSEMASEQAEERDSQLPPALGTKNGLPTRFLSEVIAADTDIKTLQQVLAEKYPSRPPNTNTLFWTEERTQLVRDIAFAVQQRSSALIAAACVGLLDCVGDISIDLAKGMTNGITNGCTETNTEVDDQPVEELVIAYAGGTISHYPLWVETCQQWINVLVEKGSAANKKKRVILKEALDGGIVGAGVLAGMTDEIA